MKSKLVIISILFMLGFFLLFRISPTDMKSPSLTVKKFATIPVLHNGRIKPLDSVARNTLILIQGKQTIKLNNIKISAIEWLLTVLTQSEKADDYPVFLINNPEVKMLLGIFDLQKKTVSFNDLVPHFETISNQTNSIHKIDRQLRSPYQKEVINLYDRIMLYHRLKNSYFIEGTHSFSKNLLSFEKKIQEMKQFIKETNHQFDTLSEEQKKKISQSF